jgi:hypothetical protein
MTHSDYKLDKLGVAGSNPASPTPHSESCFTLQEVEHPCDVPGLHSIRLGEANSAYHSDRPYDNKSLLALFGKSPVLYYEQVIAQTHTPVGSDSLQYGTLVHLLMELGEVEFNRRAAVAPDPYVTAAGAISTKADALKWRASLAPDSIPVSPADMAMLKRQLAQIRANGAARELFECPGWSEVSIRWMRPDGSKLRCRDDKITDIGQVVDWKTTRDEQPLKTWWTAARQYDYFLQAALYEEGARMAGLPDLPMLFVLLSTTTFQCHVVTLPRPLVAAATERLNELLADLRLCREMESYLPQDYGQITELFVPPHVYA